MSSSKNYVCLLGNAGAGPEVSTIPSGTKVARVNLATNEYFTSKDGEKQQNTEWHRLVFWGKLADVAGSYIKKGSLIEVDGKLQTRSWEKGGERRYTTEVVVKELRLLSHAERAAEAGPAKSEVPVGVEDDLPF